MRQWQKWSVCGHPKTCRELKGELNSDMSPKGPLGVCDYWSDTSKVGWKDPEVLMLFIPLGISHEAFFGVCQTFIENVGGDTLLWVNETNHDNAHSYVCDCVQWVGDRCRRFCLDKTMCSDIYQASIVEQHFFQGGGVIMYNTVILLWSIMKNP